MKAKTDAERILSGKKSADAPRALAVARALETEARGAASGAIHHLRVALLNHLLLTMPSGLHLTLSGDGLAIELRTSPTGAAVSLALAEVAEQTRVAVQQRGIGVDWTSPAALGLDVEVPVEMPAGWEGLSAERYAEIAQDSGTPIDGRIAAWALAAVRSGAAPWAIDGLGEALIAEQRWELARRLVQSPRFQNSRFLKLSALLCEVELRLGKPEAALRALPQQPAKGLSEDAEINALRAAAFAALGSTAEATSALAQLAASSNDNRRVAWARDMAERHIAGALAAARQTLLDAVQSNEPTRIQTALHVLSAAGAPANEVQEAQALLHGANWRFFAQKHLSKLQAAPDLGEVMETADALVAHFESIDAKEERQLAAKQLGELADAGQRRGQWAGAAGLWTAAVRIWPESSGRAGTELARWAVEAAVLTAAPPSVVGQSLVRLGAARALLHQGRAPEALLALTDLAPTLRGLATFNALYQQAQDETAASRLEHAKQTLSEADALAANEDWTLALQCLGRTDSPPSGLVQAFESRRAEWTQQARADESANEMASRIREQLTAGAPFAARRTLAALPLQLRSRPLLAALHSEVEAAAAALLPVEALVFAGPPSAPGVIAQLTSESLGWSAVQPKDVRVGMVAGSGNLLLAANDQVAIVDGTSLQVAHLVRLPNALLPGKGGDAIVASAVDGDHRIVLWGAENRKLTVVRLHARRAEVESVIDLSKALPKRAAKQQVAQSVAMHDATSSFWVLDTFQRGPKRHESRLRAFKYASGDVSVAEEYPHALFQIAPLQDRAEVLVSRAYEPAQQRGPGWYKVALLDSQGRVQVKWPLASSEDEIHAIRRAAQSPCSGRWLVEYWPLDMVTGKVTGDGTSLLVLKPEGSLIYENRTPTTLLGGGVQRTSGAALHCDADGRDWLLYPALSQDRRAWVCAVSGADLRPSGRILCGENSVVGAIRSDPARRRSFTVTFPFEGGGFRLQHLVLNQMQPHPTA